MDNQNHQTHANPYAATFERYQQSQTAARLQTKFQPLPYYVRFKWLRLTTLSASYFFNLFSGLTASALVYFFGVQLLGHWLPAAAVTLAFLAILEVSKRVTAAANFKDYYQYRKTAIGLISVSLLLMVLSVSFSYFGAKRAVKELTPPPIVTNTDSLTAPLLNRVTAIDAEIAAARRTTYRGTTTRTSQRTIETLTAERANLQNQIFAIEATAATDDDATQTNHQIATAINADTFALVTLLSELCFLLCAWYLEYYDFRSYVEMNFADATAAASPLPDNDTKQLKNKPLQTPDFDNDRQQLFEKARKNYNAYKSKLNNGKGNTETNLAGMERWRKEMELLKADDQPLPEEATADKTPTADDTTT